MKQPMEQALKVARGNLKEIRTVTEWAERMEYDCPKYFSRKFRNYFGERPKSQLVKLRIKRFYVLLEEKPNTSCYEIALELGLKDEIALNRFIKRHTGRPPTEWKKG